MLIAREFSRETSIILTGHRSTSVALSCPVEVEVGSILPYIYFYLTIYLRVRQNVRGPLVIKSTKAHYRLFTVD